MYCSFNPLDVICSIKRIINYTFCTEPSIFLFFCLLLHIEFTCHSQCIFAIAWISDRLLCATSGDQTTVIYDIETGGEIDLLRGHTMSVRSVCKLQYSTSKLNN